MISRDYRFAKNGFTLLEFLIVVLVSFIIGAFLVSKYQEIRQSANILVLKGMKLSLDGAEKMTYNAALLKGVEKQLSGSVALQLWQPLVASDISLDSEVFTVATRYGYPQGRWSEIIKIVELDENKWRYQERNAGDIAEVILWTSKGGGSIDQCNIRYQGAQQVGSRPKIILNTTGC